MAFRSVTATTNGGSGAIDATLTKPTGTAANDVLLAVYGNAGGSGSTITWPSGFTEFIDFSVGSPDAISYRAAIKIAGGSEPADYTITSSGNDFRCAFILSDSGRDHAAIGTALAGDFSSFFIETNDTTADGLNGVMTGVTALAGDDIIAVCGQIPADATAGTWTSPASYTERVDNPQANYMSLTAATRDAVSAGATGNLTFVLGGGASNAGFSGFVLRLPVAAGGSTAHIYGAYLQMLRSNQ
jgi:hypothetical protein